MRNSVKLALIVGGAVAVTAVLAKVASTKAVKLIPPGNPAPRDTYPGVALPPGQTPYTSPSMHGQFAPSVGGYQLGVPGKPGSIEGRAILMQDYYENPWGT